MRQQTAIFACSNLMMTLMVLIGAANAFVRFYVVYVIGITKMPALAPSFIAVC